jgi:hypothetical protein
LSSAIRIDHPSFTERDWYAVDAKTSQVVEVQGTVRRNLGGPNHVFHVSASVDPQAGIGEVYVLAGPVPGTAPFGMLWRCDSRGNWTTLPGLYKGISATHDGGVYAVWWDGHQVIYWNFQGIPTNLSAPNPGNGPWASSSVAASHGWFGGNEVFAISSDEAIYVNSTNVPGQWRLVDNTQRFWEVSASQNDAVFALAGPVGSGTLFEETEHFCLFPKPHFYWTNQNITGPRSFTAISADSDTSGQAEVYAIQSGTQQAFLYDLGFWAVKDTNVFDISGADGGYFYDVRYAGIFFTDWQHKPVAPFLTFLGLGLL